VLALKRIKSRRLNKSDKFIIALLDKRELGFNILFRAYKERFKEERVVSRCVSIVKQLEKRALVTCKGLVGGRIQVQEEMFQLTDTGKKRYEKLEGVKDEAEKVYEIVMSDKSGEKIELHEEVMFMLSEFANQRDKKLNEDILRKIYFGVFKDKTEADFNIAWGKLERNGFIEWADIFGYDDRHSITNNGLDYLERNRTNK
jgi:hypothetical protein